MNDESSGSIQHIVLDLAIMTTKWIVQKRGFHFESLGLSIRDVAMDAVAELLTDDGNEMPIIRYLNENAGDTDDPVLIEAHLRAIVVRTINQNITRILAEYDPIYAKSLRMLRIHVRRTEGISVRQSLSGCWYYHGNDADAGFHLPALSSEDLSSLIVIRRSDQNPSVKVLHACLQYLSATTEYRRAVHETDVMRLTMDLLGDELHALTTDAVDARGDLDYKHLEEAIETAIADTRLWATSQYVQKKKLSAQELEAMINAIRMFVLDSADGETESHYYYLRLQMSGLSYDRFRQDYRNTFQYILRRFFTNARELLVSLGYRATDATMDTKGE